MPSPVAHIGMGYLIYRLYRFPASRSGMGNGRPQPRLLMATTALSLMPDVDVLPGLVHGDLGKYHNHFTSSVAFGLLVALMVGGAVWLHQGSGFRRWSLVAATAYQMHLVMDYATCGSGVMLAWPFTTERFSSPVALFNGLHYSEGWNSARHLLTLVNEMGFLGLAGVALLALRRR